ncbi:MAG: hypothetical protein WKF85_15050 [Chitinophagaceae bacterium]
MKKLLLAVALIGSSTAAVVAQETEMKSSNTTFSIAGNVGSGTSRDYKLAAGADIQLDIPIGSTLKFTASAGYENMAYDINGSKDHSGYIPLLGGLKFGIGKGLYAHGQVGYAFNTTNNPGSDNDGNFAYAPSIGYGFGKNFDLAAKYISFGPKAIVARLAYNF